MELLTSLPADFAAIADASARGPAPLLRLPETQGAPAAAATPFALCLALLTAEAPGGEAWPVAGKELPVLPLDVAAETDDVAELALSPLAVFGPPAFAQAALPAQLLLGAVPEPALPSATTAVPLPLLPTAAELAPPALPSGDLPTPDALAPHHIAGFDPLAEFAALGSEPTPLDAAAPPAATATAKTAPAPSWLDAFIDERRLQRPAAATPADVRAAAAPAAAATPLAAASAPLATAAAVDAPVAVQGAGRRSELPKIVVSSTPAAESASASRAEWLPPAAGHSAATGAAAPPASPLGAPVDFRSPNWQEAFANRVQWLVDTQVGEAHIKLNPPELGAVDVKISLVDDKTYVQLTTATAAARDELANGLARLRELFTGSGLELGGASVHNGRAGPQGGQGSEAGGAAGHSSPLTAFAADLDGLPALASRRAQGRIDIFA
jgi:flagellar hook-length control protein FliK